MEGNYQFEWTTISPTGKLLGKFEQTIYGKDLPGAISKFVEFYGKIGADAEGDMIKINLIRWSPL